MNKAKTKVIESYCDYNCFRIIYLDAYDEKVDGDYWTFRINHLRCSRGQHLNEQIFKKYIASIVPSFHIKVFPLTLNFMSFLSLNLSRKLHPEDIYGLKLCTRKFRFLPVQIRLGEIGKSKIQNKVWTEYLCGKSNL